MAVLSPAGTGGGVFADAELPAVAATSDTASAASSASAGVAHFRLPTCIETLHRSR